MLRAENRCPEAISEFETVLETEPNTPEALHALGWCRLLAGSIEEVIPLEERAIRLSPHDPSIGFKYARIALVHLLESRSDDAISWLEKATSGESEFYFTHSGLAAAYALKGETRRAASELGELRRVAGSDFSSIARIRTRVVGVRKIRDMYDTTYLAGLQLAGVPEK